MENRSKSPISFVLFIVFSLPALSGCTKRADTYTKFIVGCWNYQDPPKTLTLRSFSMRFNDDGTYYYTSGSAQSSGPFPYYMHGDTIFVSNSSEYIIDKMKWNFEHNLVIYLRTKNATGSFNTSSDKYLKVRRKCN